ncbi:MAG: hypothetical protein ABJL67_15610, partial [Sulfitobacter sp.]
MTTDTNTVLLEFLFQSIQSSPFPNHVPHGDPTAIEEGVIDARTDRAWMRRHFADSIYLWACGEKANEDDD